LTFVTRKEVKTAAKRENLNNLNIKEISKPFMLRKIRGKKAYYINIIGWLYNKLYLNYTVVVGRDVLPEQFDANVT